MKSQRRIFALLYAVSGAAGLVYEVTWTRLLTVTMGHSVAAASTVLAAFMGGLAAGSWAGGLIDDRFAGLPHSGRRRLQLYALLESIIALSAVLLPLVLLGSTPVLAWSYRDGTSPGTFLIVRLILCIVVLGIPTAAMGATFPIAAAWFTEGEPDAPRVYRMAPKSPGRRGRPPQVGRNGAASAGWLYAMNSAGASFGAMAAGLWLIPSFGLRGSTWSAVALNIIAAFGALHLSRLREANQPSLERSQSSTTATKHPASESDTRGHLLMACAAAGTSGLIALVYEVVWTRLLALVIGPTTYAFTIIVAAFIIGIAVGSAIGSRLAARSANAALWLALMLLLTASAASAAGWYAATQLPLVVAAQVSRADAAFDRIVLKDAFEIVLLLLPMTCALGAAFPLALAVASIDSRHVGRRVSKVYASNTVGAIAGALLGGFVVLPGLGLRNAFRVTAIVGAVAALALGYAAIRATGRRWLSSAVVGAVVVALGIAALLPPWDLRLLASGAYKYAPLLGDEDMTAQYRAWRLLSYKDGAAATVSVRELAGMRSLVIDGKVDASNMGDMLTQRLLGLLPVLLHPDPQDVCIIGLGSGVTASSTLARGRVRRADVIEISPEVVDASRLFVRENGDVLNQPNVRLIVGDGRSHFRLTKNKYDVIVSEPSNPWMAGIAALFTQEFFTEARARLNENGVMCQWAHTYNMSPDDVRSIVRTFTSVFPEATMWLVGDSDLLLIGSGVPIDLRSIERHCREARVPAMLNDVAIHVSEAPLALLSMLVGRTQDLKHYGDGAPIQRDDRMALEFTAPRAIYGPTSPEIAAAMGELTRSVREDPSIRPIFEQATDKSWTVAGAMELKADAYEFAFDRFAKAVQLNANNREALAGLSDAASGARRQEDARRILEEIRAAQPQNAAVRLELSRLLAALGDSERAAALAGDAVRLVPTDPAAVEQLASVFADAGNAQQLKPVADALVSRFPEREKGHYYLANALFLSGRTLEAIDVVQQIVRRNPGNVQGQNLLGVACATAGRRDCALAAFDAALAADARDATTHVNLGVFHLQSGSPAAAVEDFSTALALDRSSTAAAQGLAEARAAAGAR